MSFSVDAAVAPPKPSPGSNDGETGRAIELGDESRVAEPLALPDEHAMLEKKDPARLHDGQSTISVGGGNVKPDLQRVDVAPVNAASECEESKLSERGIHSLTHSVTGDSSRPISEVEEGDAHFDESGEVSSENSAHESPKGQKGQRGLLNEDHALVRDAERDDFEGADGEIDSVKGGRPQGPHSELLTPRAVSPNGRVGEGAGNDEEDGGEVVQASPELQDRDLTSESKSDAVSGQRYPLYSKAEELGTNEDDFGAERTDSSADVEEDDAASNLGTQLTDPQDEDDEAAQQLRLDSEIGLLSAQELNPEDEINPLSLEGGTKKAREQRDIFLEGEGETIAGNVAGISKAPLDVEETNRSVLLDSEEISPIEPNGISERAVETGFPSSQVKERKRTGALSEDGVDDAQEPLANLKPGVGEAVLLGALASGVNVRFLSFHSLDREGIVFSFASVGDWR